MSDTSPRRVVFILLRMKENRLACEPEPFEDFEDAEEAFEEYTGSSWIDIEALTEESGADPDDMPEGPFAGSRILTVELPIPSQTGRAA